MAKRTTVRARVRAGTKSAATKKTAAKASSPGGAKRNPGQPISHSRIPLRSMRATSPGKKKLVAAKEERAPIRLDGRRLSRRIEFTPRLTEHIRQRYEEAGDGPDVIARSVGVAKATIQRLVREQGWTRAVQGPRDLTRAEQLAAEARALAAHVGGQGATLPPRSGGEGRRTLREHGEPGWGVGADTMTASDVEVLPPPTPDPSPQSKSGLPDFDHFQMPNSGKPEFGCAARAGGGEKDAAAPKQDAELAEQEAVDIDQQIERLLRLVSAEIGVYENLRATLKGEPQPQREALKTAHNLASLTSTLDTLRRMRAGQMANASHDDNDDLPTDIDALRDALARRIEAFMASRPDDGNAGADDAEGADGA